MNGFDIDTTLLNSSLLTTGSRMAKRNTLQKKQMIKVNEIKKTIKRTIKTVQ